MGDHTASLSTPSTSLSFSREQREDKKKKISETRRENGGVAGGWFLHSEETQ